MRMQYLIQNKIVTIVSVLLIQLGATIAHADNRHATYRVTIQNITAGQALSPAVGATHRPQIDMFRVGKLASKGLEAIAEDGDQSMMFMRFSNLIPEKATGVFGGPSMPPLTPFGTTVGDFTDALTRTVMVRPGDRFSMATMLICTNDGFTGLDRVKLPRKGSKIFLSMGYDAGTEDNTEISDDIVDPCSALGPVPLMGDPNGNENASINTDPHRVITHHPNILGVSDLSVEQHGWTDPAAKITITRVAENARKFLARLMGAGEVPIVDTDATGRATFRLHRGSAELRFKLNVHDIEGVTQAHIHHGLPNENGPVVAFLFGPSDQPGSVDGKLAKGILTEDDLLANFEDDFSGFVDALRNGELYVNVHTVANQPGEIRGQIGTAP